MDWIIIAYGTICLAIGYAVGYWQASAFARECIEKQASLFAQIEGRK